MRGKVVENLLESGNSMIPLAALKRKLRHIVGNDEDDTEEALEHQMQQLEMQHPQVQQLEMQQPQVQQPQLKLKGNSVQNFFWQDGRIHVVDDE